MATRAVVGEARSCHCSSLLCPGQVGIAARARPSANAERCSSGRTAPCRESAPRSPASRRNSCRATAISIGDDWLAANQRAEVQQPLLAEQADVEIHAVQGAQSLPPSRNRPSARAASRPVRRLEELGPVYAVPGWTYSLNCLLLSSPPASVSCRQALGTFQTWHASRRPRSWCADY